MDRQHYDYGEYGAYRQETLLGSVWVAYSYKFPSLTITRYSKLKVRFDMVKALRVLCNPTKPHPEELRND